MRRVLALALLAGCAPEAPAPPPTPEASAAPDRPVDDVVEAAPGARGTVAVLDNDPDGLALVGIGAPTGAGAFGVPADGLARGLVTYTAPGAGEAVVWYRTEGPAGGDSARVVVRVR